MLSWLNIELYNYCRLSAIYVLTDIENDKIMECWIQGYISCKLVNTFGIVFTGVIKTNILNFIIRVIKMLGTNNYSVIKESKHAIVPFYVR